MSGNVHPLVPGTIKDIVEGQKPAHVWLQVIFIKPIEKDGGSGGSGGSGSSGSGSRYKVAVSDSRNFIQAMVVSPMSQAFDQKLVEQWSIVRVTTYQLNTLKGHTFLVLGNMGLDDIIKAGSKYGEPANIEQALSSANSEPVRPADGAGLSTYSGSGSGNSNGSGSGNNNGSGNGSVSSNSVPTIASGPKANPFQSNVAKYDDAEGGGNAQAHAGGNKRGFATSPLSSNPVGGYYEEPDALQTIANLSPYHNRWAIKARIINKSDVKKFANAKGEGKLFSATCIDSTGEIRMTAFGEAVDKFFDLVHEGQVYFISNAQVKIAKRQFGVRNEYEVHLEPSSLVTLARDAGEVPSLRYSFVPIAQITSLEKDAVCDVIGIIRDAGDLGSVTTKTTQKQLSKRDLTLVDTTACAIKLTLWGAQAENFHDAGNYPVLAIRGARVSDYNGRTLSSSAASHITLNPDIREAHELRGWFDSQGVNQETRSISLQGTGLAGGASLKDDRKLISQIKEDHLGQGEKPDFFSLYATIVYIKSDSVISYTACPTEGCNKKVMEEGPNMWRCEKCQKVYDRCDHRYILSLQVADHTGQTWLNAFNETGEQLLGKSAEELYYLRSSDEVAYTAYFKEALFKPYHFRIRAKQENYQGEMKLRCNVLAALPVSAEDECKFLLGKIEKSVA